MSAVTPTANPVSFITEPLSSQNEKCMPRFTDSRHATVHLDRGRSGLESATSRSTARLSVCGLPNQQRRNTQALGHCGRGSGPHVPSDVRSVARGGHHARTHRHQSEIAVPCLGRGDLITAIEDSPHVITGIQSVERLDDGTDFGSGPDGARRG